MVCVHEGGLERLIDSSTRPSRVVTRQVSLCEGSAPVLPAPPAFLELLEKGGKGPLGITCRLWSTLHLHSHVYSCPKGSLLGQPIWETKFSPGTLGVRWGQPQDEMQLGGALGCPYSIPHLQDHGV